MIPAADAGTAFTVHPSKLRTASSSFDAEGVLLGKVRDQLTCTRVPDTGNGTVDGLLAGVLRNADNLLGGLADLAQAHAQRLRLSADNYEHTDSRVGVCLRWPS